MATLYRDLTQRLREKGCYFVRQGRGSHEIWYSPLTSRAFTIPANITSRDLANQILKQAGLPKAF